MWKTTWTWLKWERLWKSALWAGMFGLVMWGGGFPQGRAAGVFFSGNGVVSGARAGAVVATGKSAEMFIFNPANLSKLRGFGFSFSNALSFQFASFKRANSGSVSFERVEKDPNPGYIPWASFWYNFDNVGPGALTIQLFGHGPHGRNNYVYPEKPGKCRPAKVGSAKVCDPMPISGPNRLAVIYSRSITAYAGLAAGYELRLPHEIKLRFGSTFRVQYVNASQKQSIIAASLLGYNDKKLSPSSAEVQIEILGDGVTFTGDVAFGVDLPYGLRVGASVLFPSTSTLNGKLNIEMSKTLENLGVQVIGNQMTATTSFPLIFRTGVGWVGYGFSVEVAMVAELWESARKQTLNFNDIRIKAKGFLPEEGVGIDPVELDLYFRDSFSVRIGAEYNLKNWVWFRLGWFYESGALKENQVSVSSIDYPDKLAITAGISVRIPIGLMLDAGVVHIFGRNIKVTNSPIIPTDVSPEALKSKVPIQSTSNGDYYFGMTALFFGVRGNWGGGKVKNPARGVK